MARERDWMAALDKLDETPNSADGAESFDPYVNGLELPSPSIGFIFGNTHLLPAGYTSCWWGPPKGGKSVMAKALIGRLHANDPEAYAVYFDTEFRFKAQMTPKMTKLYGIDLKRIKAYETNLPEEIFDRIEFKLAEMCEKGFPLKLIVIDSITGVLGRRMLNAKSVNTQQIGDAALTQQEGLKRILRTIRKYGIHLMLIDQQRAEMDVTEQMRGKTAKMAGGWYLKHFAEYFVYIEALRTKAGRTDLYGNTFTDKSLQDVDGNEERTGVKMRVRMEDSSCSPKGRTGIFTFDFNRGIINTHEELYLLGKNRGIITLRGASHDYDGQTWRGKDAMLKAIAENPELAQKLHAAIKLPDILSYRGEGATGAETGNAAFDISQETDPEELVFPDED